MLKSLVIDWSARFGIRADFESTGTDNGHLSPEVVSNLFRLVQEALHNIATHARARQVKVTLEQRGETATLVIDDDGCGFDPEEVQARAGNGVGLTNMRERALLLGGDLDVDSMPGRGTTILVRVPAWSHTIRRAR